MTDDSESPPDILYTAGIRIDCNKVIDQFIRTNSLRYEEFSQIWRQMNMSLIFYGREDFRELQEFIETVLSMAKKLWLQPEIDIHSQVAGFYLVYGFYTKQPTISQSPVKIRMTMEEWKICKTFVSFLLENEHWDAYYIFYKLMADNAFDYVFQKAAINPGSCTHANDDIRKLKPRFESRLQSYIDDSSFQVMQNHHEAYEAMKKEVIPRELCLTDANLIDNIRKLVKPGSETVSGLEDSFEMSGNGQAMSDIGQRRLLLKRKMFTDGKTRKQNDI